MQGVDDKLAKSDTNGEFIKCQYFSGMNCATDKYDTHKPRYLSQLYSGFYFQSWFLVTLDGRII